MPVNEARMEIKVTLAVGAAIALQSAAGLIWAGAAGERLAQLERRADETRVIVERTARLEEQARSIRASVERIEARLERDAMEARHD